MTNKKRPTLEDFIDAGNCTKSFKCEFFNLLDKYQKIFTKTEMYKFRMETFMKNFEKSRSDAEAKMFNENPDLSNDYLKVFYGPKDERFKIENGELSKYYEERYSTENLLKILHEFNNRQKYRWHDLRKNPKDVPENQNTVLTSVNGVVCLNFYSNGRWYETNGLEDDINMDAWREIEPFEDDNNDN